ncbi:MAG TPA: DUF2007 domain-containing protein [Flavobacterium sp.]|nr:DUF2007 domain-containing protein [Flavobacterium sp.]
MEDKYIKIFTGTSVMAMAVQNALSQNEIDFIVKDEGNTVIIAGFPPVHIYVKEEDEDRAKYVLVDINFDDIDDL